MTSLTMSKASALEMVRRVKKALKPLRTWMSEPSAPTTQGTPRLRAVRKAP
jgi:hypothetical protein